MVKYNKKLKNTKDLIIVALLVALLIVQEQLLTFIPNVQLTFFMLVLFSKKLNIVHSFIICFIYVLLDSFLAGSFNLFLPFMMIGVLFIPLSINTIFKKVESNILLALLGILYSFIYSFILIIPGCILFNMDFITYLKGDIIYEIVLAISSFISILLLYNPCSKIFDEYYKKRT